MATWSPTLRPWPTSCAPHQGCENGAPQVWELIVEAGRDPVTGKRRQVSRIFRGNLRDGEEGQRRTARRRGQGSSHRHPRHRRRPVRRLDHRARTQRPVAEHGPRLREGLPPQHRTRRSAPMPVTKVTTKMLTDLYGAHQRRGLRPAASTRSMPASRRCSPRRADGVGATRTLRSGPSRRRSRTSSRSCRPPMRSER